MQAQIKNGGFYNGARSNLSPNSGGYDVGMRVAIIGFGVEGRVSARYFTGRGHQVTICDQSASVRVPKLYGSQLGDGYLRDLERFDLIVRSAGIAPHAILDQNPTVGSKMTTAINEFLQHSPTKHVIGITGTKGKGTTSTLTAKILEATGETVWLAGNIGRSPLEFIDAIKPEDWVVLELSSFQLIDVQYSPHIATCLMVVPEHLNWHADMNDYTAAKSRLFTYQTSDDVAVYFSENNLSSTLSLAGAGKKVPYYRPPGAWINGNMVTIDGLEVCTTAELKLIGKHNWQNVCAAITTVWQAGVRDIHAVRSVITSFSGLEHRLEFVRELNGVSYYDDSFGTTPETAIVAIEAFRQPKVVILGGSDKGATYDELAKAVAQNDVRAALLIGEQAEKIKTALNAVGFSACTHGGTTMSEIVANAKAAARSGDAVLLSTGCASFGLFKDYKDRGDQFKSAVMTLN